MTEGERQTRLLVGVCVSIALHVIAVLLIALLPKTSVARLISPDTTASSSAQGRGFPGQTGDPGGTSGPAPPRDADESRVPASGEPSSPGQASETPGSASIAGLVVDDSGRPVAGVTIGYLTASARRADAQVRYGAQSRAATVDGMPLARRRTLIDWLTRIDPQETYSGGTAAGVTDRTGTFTINVSQPDTYIVTVRRQSPSQIGSVQPVIVRAGDRINLPRPIELVEGWAGPGVDGQSGPVRARDLADDDPRGRSWGRQRQFFSESNLMVVSWQEAQEVLLVNDLRGGKEYHTGWLTIYTKSDNGYLTKLPDGAAFWRFARQYSLPMEGFGSE